MITVVNAFRRSGCGSEDCIRGQIIRVNGEDVDGSMLMKR